MVIVQKILISFIKFYQNYISEHLHAILPMGGCRFIPTCSEYACQALEKYGTIKGLFLAAFRVFRCNPFAKGGSDPLP